MNPADAVAKYLAELAEQRRLSPHTVSNYRRDLDKLIAIAAETPLAKLQVHQIRRFVAQLHGKGLSGLAGSNSVGLAGILCLAWRT
mgnify:CR=1 FL=1